MSENVLDLSLFKTSSVGTTVDSYEDEVQIDYDFSWISWLFITCLGTTRLPRAIKFTCKKTGEVFEVVTDEKRIKHFMRFRRK